MRNAVASSWHITAVREQDNYCYVLTLQSGEYEAEVDVQAFEDRHGDSRLEVLGECPLGDALGREAVAALLAEVALHERALAHAVMFWFGRPYALAARKAA